MSIPSPENFSSQSSSSSNVATTAGNRVMCGSLNLQASQCITLPSTFKQQLIQYQSSTLPSWGSLYSFDLKDKGQMINHLTLAISIGPVVGSSPVGYWAVAHSFFQKMDYLTY